MATAVMLNWSRNNNEAVAPAELDGNEDEPKKGTSWYAAVFIVVNTAIGTGFLNLPSAYHRSGGIAVGLTLQFIFGLLVVGSMFVLIFCCQQHRSISYEACVLACCGPVALVVCAVCIFIYSFGTDIVYFIIIGDQWDKFLSLVYGPKYCDFWYMKRYFTITASGLVCVLPLCYPRKIDFLKYASALGSVAVIYCIVMMTVKYFAMPGQRDDEKCPLVYSPEHAEDVFKVIPAICFGYQCSVSLVAIFACTKKPELLEFAKTFVTAVGICIVGYSFSGCCGYLTFGSCVEADVLSSYHPSPDVVVCISLIAIHVCTTYPILLYIGRSALVSVIQYVQKVVQKWPDDEPRVQSTREERAYRFTVASFWFIFTLLIAICVPDIGVVISLLGGLAATFIFLFPGLCLVLLVIHGYFGADISRRRYLLLLVAGFFYLAVGIIVFILTTVQSIYDVVVHFLYPANETAAAHVSNGSDHCADYYK